MSLIRFGHEVCGCRAIFGITLFGSISREHLLALSCGPGPIGGLHKDPVLSSQVGMGPRSVATSGREPARVSFRFVFGSDWLMLEL